MIKPIIYIASPYSHSDENVRLARFQKVAEYAGELTAGGKLAFSPITYGHVLATIKEMPTDWEFWQSFCISFLSKCDELHVLKLDGWDKSQGVEAEINWAVEHIIPVKYIDV